MFNEILKAEAENLQTQVDEAKEAFDKTFWAFMNSVVPFDYQDPILWKFVSKLVSRCEEDRSVESACHNTFCYWERDGNTMTDALRAVATIEKIKGKLYKPMGEFIHDRGDDGFGDLMDSFFLAGPSIVGQILDGLFCDGDYEEVYRLTTKQCSPKIVNLIWDGENYFGMSLEKASKTFFRNAEIYKEEKKTYNVEEGENWYDKF